MRKTSFFLRAFVMLCMTFTFSSISATLPSILPDGEPWIDDYVTPNYHCIFNGEISGEGLSDENSWRASIDRATLPELEIGKTYGMIVATRYNGYINICDYGMNFTYTCSVCPAQDSGEEDIFDYGTLEYDGVGIYQIAQDPPGPTIDDDPFDFLDNIEGCYFQTGEYLFSENPVSVIIYDGYINQ